MGESKHTPGKWVARRHQNAAYGARHGGRFVIIAECPGAVDFFVAEQRHPMVTGESESQSEANARLIAAAPDLLSVVKRFVALPSGAWHPERHAAEEAALMQDARAVVAKAEGLPDA